MSDSNEQPVHSETQDFGLFVPILVTGIGVALIACLFWSLSTVYLPARLYILGSVSTSKVERVTRGMSDEPITRGQYQSLVIIANSPGILGIKVQNHPGKFLDTHYIDPGETCYLLYSERIDRGLVFKKPPRSFLSVWWKWNSRHSGLLVYGGMANLAWAAVVGSGIILGFAYVALHLLNELLQIYTQCPSRLEKVIKISNLSLQAMNLAFLQIALLTAFFGAFKALLLVEQAPLPELTVGALLVLMALVFNPVVSIWLTQKLLALDASHLVKTVREVLANLVGAFALTGLCWKLVVFVKSDFSNYQTIREVVWEFLKSFFG